MTEQEPDVALPTWALDAVRDLDPLLTKLEASAFLRRSGSTLDRAISSGHLLVVRSAERGPSRVLIPRVSLACYLVYIQRGQS